MPAILLLLFLSTLIGAETPDPVLATQMVQRLGLRDDVQGDSRWWLESRIGTVWPQVIEGLSSTEDRVVSGCLDLLAKAPLNQNLRDPLLRIGQGGRYSRRLQAQALVVACRLLPDPLVTQAITGALDEAGDKMPALDRARLQNAIGQTKEAVKTVNTAITEFIQKKLSESSSSDSLGMIHLVETLATVKDVTAIEALQVHALAPCWELASRSRLLLAKVAVDRFPLSATQMIYLNENHHAKMSQEAYQKRWDRMAALDRKEITPLVHQQLASDDPRMAVEVVVRWQDREALPLLWNICNQVQPWKVFQYRRAKFVSAAAILGLDTDPAVLEKVLVMFDPRVIQDLLPQVLQLPISVDRRLQIYQHIRKGRDASSARFMAESLRLRPQDLKQILPTLIEQEQDPVVLAEFARMAARDPGKDLQSCVQKVLDRILVMPAPDITAVQILLQVLQEHPLPGIGPQLERWFTHEKSQVRIAAAAAALTCGSDRTICRAILYKELGSVDGRSEAIRELRRIPCQDEKERSVREQTILALAQGPARFQILPLLNTCLGPTSTAFLKPYLEGEDYPMSLLAACVLAQHTDAKISEPALRRVALNRFVLEPMVPQCPPPRDAPILAGANNTPFAVEPVKLLKQYQVPFPLVDREIDFLIRAYRWAISLHGIESSWRFGGSSIHAWKSGMCDASYLPFLRIMRDEDPYLTVCMVQGQPLPWFPHRAWAAEQIATLTGKPAQHPGLDGSLQAKLPTTPYPDQDRLIVRHVIAAWERQQKAASEWEERFRTKYWPSSSLIYDPPGIFGQKVDEQIREVWAEHERKGNQKP